MRRFNTAGPCRPEYDYMIPAAGRVPAAVELVDRQAYFALHAPRQTGKTTTMHAFARQLTAAGRYAALHFSCEIGRAVPEDIAEAGRAVWSSIEHARPHRRRRRRRTSSGSSSPTGRRLARGPWC
jgi:hypothetical protein